MSENTLLGQILDRLGRSKSAEEFFGADEIADWPAGSFDRLNKAGVLKPAPPAKSVDCDGCEQNCFMPVNVQTTEGNKSRTRAFISCDKPVNYGRIAVEVDRLKRWRISGGVLAKTVANLLKFERQPNEEEGHRWNLGVLKGKKHKAEIKLTVKQGISLTVSGHVVPLSEILELRIAGLSIDRDELLRLADKPANLPGRPVYKTSIVRREARKLETEKRYMAWNKAAKALRKKPQGKSDRWVSQQIAKTDTGKGWSADTIRKHIR